VSSRIYREGSFGRSSSGWTISSADNAWSQSRSSEGRSSSMPKENRGRQTILSRGDSQSRRRQFLAPATVPKGPSTAVNHRVDLIVRLPECIGFGYPSGQVQTSHSGCSGRNSSEFTTLKMAVLAPIPSARAADGDQ
jgi:hypothetical protein